MATNVYFGDRGEAIRRDGYSILTSGGATNVAGRFLYRFTTATYGTTFLIYIGNDGYIYSLDVASETVLRQIIGDPNPQMSATGTATYYQKAAVVFDDVFYATDLATAFNCNGMAAGGAAALLGAMITDNTLDGDGGEFPLAKALTVWNDRIVAGNVKSGSTRYPSRLWFSEVADGLTWESTSWITVGQDDGGEIQQILPYGDSLLIWKDHAFYAVTGDYPDLSVQLIHGSIGTVSGLSVAQDQTNVFWFDATQGVFMFDGSTVQRIDQAVHTDILTTNAASQRVSGAVWNDRYYLGIPSIGGGGPAYTWVFHMRTGAWSKWSKGWQSSCVYGDDMYASGLVATEQGIAKLFQGALTDNGTDFTWTLETPWLPPIAERGLFKYRLPRLQAYFKGQTAVPPETATVSIVIRTDFDDTTAATTISASTSSTNQGVISDTTGHNAMFDVFKLAFSSDQQVAAQLFGFAAAISARGPKQGAST